MALTHPNTPELKRYTFFVSRQREDGRERFRLHMGYFASQEAAEALLAAVRDVYPAAWAGPAPTTGVPRRARVTVAPTVLFFGRGGAEIAERMIGGYIPDFYGSYLDDRLRIARAVLRG